MSHFYANIRGSRGEATRQGTKSSGILGNIRGWNVGAIVTVTYDKENNRDIVRVYKTGGSNGYTSPELIAEFTDGKPLDELI